VSKWQEAAVRQWFREHANRDFDNVLDTGPAIRSVHGLDFNGRTIEEGGRSPVLARMVRGNHDPKHTNRPPLVQLTLPNTLTINRHRLIARVVHDEGGETLAVPARLLMIAGIHDRSIDVIATQKRPHFLRAPQQLIHAHVRPSWYAKRDRAAYFLSGYDLNEPGLSYFFCELPPGCNPSTIGEAYEALQPQSVKIALGKGLNVQRQGDLFFIPMDVNFSPKSVSISNTYLNTIFNTNHCVRTIGYQDHLTYVQGTVEHRPAGRRKDHEPLRLGRRRWWLVVRNTVPVNR
jgi:hypothetical protein